jgi:hypothetical protein
MSSQCLAALNIRPMKPRAMGCKLRQQTEEEDYGFGHWPNRIGQGIGDCAH